MFNLATVFAESLKLSWAYLTYSPKALFYDINFWILTLYVSDYWLLAEILYLYSLSYLVNFACVALDNLKLYWAEDNYSPRFEFYEINFYILCLILSFSLLFCSIIFLYYEISFIIFAFWFADNLRFYWACLISSSIEVF